MSTSKHPHRNRQESAVAVAMRKRYEHTTGTMRDRRMRRAKDARKSWRREEY